jgi:hypothetical protein
MFAPEQREGKGSFNRESPILDARSVCRHALPSAMPLIMPHVKERELRKMACLGAQCDKYAAHSIDKQGK